MCVKDELYNYIGALKNAMKKAMDNERGEEIGRIPRAKLGTETVVLAKIIEDLGGIANKISKKSYWSYE